MNRTRSHSGSFCDSTAASRWLDRIRYFMIAGAGLSLPFYAFPIGAVFGRDVDVATVFAVGFVLASFRSPLFIGRAKPARLFFAVAALAPLLVFLPPRPHPFSFDSFAFSYGHWLLMILFFILAASCTLSDDHRRVLVGSCIAMAVVVSLFALYQVVGIPRHWPGTGPFLFPNQREPLRLTRIGGTYFGGGYTRPTSFFLEPAWLGGYLAWSLALALALSWRKNAGVPGPRLAWKFAACLLLISAILATVSWGAFLDLGVVLVGSLAVSPAHRTLRFRSAFPFLLLAVALLALASLSTPGRSVLAAVSHRWRMLRETPTAVSGSANAVKDSSWVRLRNAEYTLSLFKSHPLGGVGLGQFRRHAAKAPTPLAAFAQQDPWFGWLAITAEIGLLGPVLLASAILLVFSRWWRLGRSRPFASAIPVLLLLAAVQQMHTGSYIDLWWWYPLGLAAALVATCQSQEPSAAAPLV